MGRMDRNDLLRRIKATKDKLEPLLDAYKKLVAKTEGTGEGGANRGFNAEETAEHLKLGKEINAFNNEIMADQAMLRALDLKNTEDDTTAIALNLGDRSRLPQASDEYREAFLNFGRGGFTDAAARTAFANLTTVSPSTGGVLIPTILETNIFMEAAKLSVLLDISTVTFTTTIHNQQPFVGDIGLLAPRKEAEAYLRNDPVLTSKQVDIYNFGGMFPVSQELLEDAPQLESTFTRLWSRSYALTVEEYGLKGTGGQTAFFDQAGNAVTVTLAGRVCPGILTADSSTIPVVVGSSATGISTDDVIKVKQAADPSVRGSGIYLMSGDAETKILLLKDADGRPLWQPTLVAGQPSLLNGSPYRVSSKMDPVAASKTPLMFGDFKAAHEIRIRKNLTVKRSEHYLFGNGMIAIAADTRWGAIVGLMGLIARLNTPAS
ncbi:MAG: phage major capsid protein family [Akkermansiaceae bacterium]|nr:phage major capsid protein family [Akkermansiaceae bacterium]